MPIPLAVTQEAVNEALKPLCDLLGTTPRNFHTMILRPDGQIRLSVPARHEEDPAGRADSAKAHGTTHFEGDAPHPQGLGVLPEVYWSDDGCAPEWVYNLRVAVIKPGDTT